MEVVMSLNEAMVARPSTDPLESAAKMFDAAMPSKSDAELNAIVARAVRAEEVRRWIAEADRLREACRLTDDWADAYYASRGELPHVRAIAAVAIGYEKELRAVRAQPRTQKIMPGDQVEKDGRRGKCVSTDEGYARVAWENGSWTSEDFRVIEAVQR